CLLKGNLCFSLDVAPTACLLPSLTGASAKKTAEDITEAQVAEIKIDLLALAPETVEAAESTRTGAIAADTCVTELVIAAAFLGILQNFIGFIDLFELFFVTTILIRMVLHG